MKPRRVWILAAAACASLVGPTGLARAQGACDGFDCGNLPTSICDAGGFSVTLVNFVPGAGQNGGSATYTYELCSPPAGVCEGGLGLRAGESCLDNGFCQTKGQNEDPTAYCTRDCAVDSFRGLSHLNVFFPELGGVGSCLSADTEVSGSCACTPGSSPGCSVDGSVVLGDGSCYASDTPVAKCDNTSLAPGDCIQMDLTIAGELNGLGLGTAVVVSKESTDCNESCLAGPSCDSCASPPPSDGACLTRTLGFWGTHPWITNDFAPVTVCGVELVCDGASDGLSNPSCEVFECNSVMEGLGSNPGIESPTNQPYVVLVKQLTAAKLNLNATATLLDGSTCSDFSYQGKTIAEWIASCEGLCGANRKTISESGCIEALDAFNNSQDVGFDVTPAPFDRPSVDDFGNVSGADPSYFRAAQGHTNSLVIGKKTKDNDCR